MKKTISLILTLLMLCSIVLPAFAGSAAQQYIYTVPEDVEYVANMDFSGCAAVIISNPACVIEPDDCYFETVLCGQKGSAAEKLAAENGYPFIVLGEGHVHTSISAVVTPVTCVKDGKVITFCPCGETGIQTTVVPATGVHDYMYIYSFGKYVCVNCGAEKPLLPIIIDDDDDGDDYIDEDECTCVCHSDEKLDTSDFSSILNCVIYRIKLLFWRLTHKHQICECGRRHY